MEKDSETRKRETKEEQEYGDQEERETDEEKWVHDLSVDHRGRIPLRASTGVWRASLFIISELLSLFPCSCFIYLFKNFIWVDKQFLDEL